MAGNADLNKAAAARKDEFYTQLSDIEKEMRYYKRHFKGKTVLCNCDDPFESKFFEYFVKRFNALGLKKLIATCYSGSPIAGTQLSLFGDVPPKTFETPYKAVVTKVYDATGDGYIDMLDVAELFKMGENKLTRLKGNGDYRSPECVALLDEADIVVTNPPFSKFRDYVALLVEHSKDFIIIGNIGAFTYKETFPLLMHDEMWLGASIHSGDRAFWVPDDYPLEAAGCGIDPETGRKFIRVKGVRWFTTLDHRQRHEGLDLYKRYDPDIYPKYDNFDAIEVSSTSEIPCDYAGVMGVPITFLDKYSPDQFEIVGITKTWFGAASKTYPKQTQVDKNGRRSLVSKLNDGAVLKVDTPPKDKTYYEVDGKMYVQTYPRILVKNKHPEEPRS